MRRSRGSRRWTPTLNAVILPAFERARDEARALAKDAVGSKRPFHGVPFLMKDIGGQEAGATVPHGHEVR